MTARRSGPPMPAVDRRPLSRHCAFCLRPLTAGPHKGCLYLMGIIEKAASLETHGREVA
jgi:hypothetical protein